MTDDSEIAKAKIQQHQLVLLKDVLKLISGKSRIRRFNTFVAVKITRIVGSMWCAYAFALISLISLPAAIQTHNPIIIVSWIAQTFLQLVLLPIIIVGQNVQAAASEAEPARIVVARKQDVDPGCKKKGAAAEAESNPAFVGILRKK